jgi:hypothetical protein
MDGRNLGPQFNQEQMLAAGAGGHLNNASLMDIPLHKIDGREPVPAMEGGYRKGRKIRVPIEVVHQTDNDVYMLYAGNHRVHQAEINGQTHIPAFVERER